MASFTVSMVVQYLDSSGVLGFDNDGEAAPFPTAGDYLADLPGNMFGVYPTHPVTTTPAFASSVMFNAVPSPFLLVAEVDPNQPPSTRSAFFPGFE